MSNMLPMRIKDSLANLYDDVFQGFERWMPSLRRRRRGDSEEFWAPEVWGVTEPAVDVVDKDDEIVVTAELPGLDKDDFKVEILGNRLVLSGEKKAEREEKQRDYFYSECSYGSFSRSIPLPVEVETDKAKASYKNGVLHLRLPKTEKARAQKIKINVA